MSDCWGFPGLRAANWLASWGIPTLQAWVSAFAALPFSYQQLNFDYHLPYAASPLPLFYHYTFIAILGGFQKGMEINTCSIHMFNWKSSALVNFKLLSSITLPLIPGGILQRFTIYKNRAMAGGPVSPFTISTSSRHARRSQVPC